MDRQGEIDLAVPAFALCAPPCTPDYALDNGQYGVSINSGAYGTFVRDNTIAYNDSDANGAGVHIAGTGSTSNRVIANRIYDNAGIGIDIGSAGVEPMDNDATADHTSANGGLNPPFLYQSTGGHRSGSVVGHANQIPRFTNGVVFCGTASATFESARSGV